MKKLVWVAVSIAVVKGGESVCDSRVKAPYWKRKVEVFVITAGD